MIRKILATIANLATNQDTTLYIHACIHTYVYIYIHTYMAKTQREPLKDTSVNCLKAEPWMGWGHVFSIQPWFHDTLPGFELQMGGLLRLFSWVSLRHLRSKKFQGYVLCYRSFTRVRFLIMAFSFGSDFRLKMGCHPFVWPGRSASTWSQNAWFKCGGLKISAGDSTLGVE